MDFNDAVKKLRTENPDCNESDLRSMLQAQVDSEQARLSGRGKHERAVTLAVDRMRDWLATGNEFAVSLDWRDLASFATHQPTCVWCVFIAKAREAKAVAA